MGVITLTSDMGLKDHYVAVVKGALISQYPEVSLVDISHQVEPFNIFQAAFVLRNSYKGFPAGTVHMICVDDEPKAHQRYLAVLKDGQYFVASDSGVLGITLDGPPEKAVEIGIAAESEDTVFVAKDILAKAAGYLGRGGTLEFLGQETTELNNRTVFTPTTNATEIQGSIVYIDGYGNAITNISKHLFTLIGKGRPFDIYFNRDEFTINRISENYGDVPSGERMALFGTGGFLEIAINRGTPVTGGSAAQLFGFGVNSTIRIEFTNVTNR